MSENAVPYVIFIDVTTTEEEVLWEGELSAVPSVGDYVKLTTEILPSPRKVIQVNWNLILPGDSGTPPAFTYVYLRKMDRV